MILDRNRYGWIWGALASSLLVAVTVAGCQGAGGRNRVTRAEPTLSGNINDDVVIGDSPAVAAAPAPARTVGVVDRHPLFSKPRDYWESSGDNKIVKAAAATFIGVPAGFFGEMKQIVVGAPAESRY
jgi:hypothetical protein